MKKIYALFLLVFLPLLANADSVEVDGIYYTLMPETKSACVVMNPNKYSGNIVVPESIIYNNESYSVTLVQSYAFNSCPDLTSVVLPNSVKELGYFAFALSPALTSVKFPDNLTTLSLGVFLQCTGLTSAPIPSSIKTIEDYAFQDCTGLTSVIIPDNVTSIGNWAFSRCRNLSSVTVSESVTHVGCYAFEETAWYESQPDGPIYVGKVLNKIKGDDYFFTHNNFEIKDGTVSISLDAFLNGMGLNSVKIPNSVVSIDNRAFMNCPQLISLTIPSSVTSIGSEAFSSCDGLTSIVVEGGNPVYDSRGNCNAIVETGTNTLIFGCQNTTIPQSIIAIADNAFSGCETLAAITIPNSVTTIGNSAFHWCTGLTTLTIPSSVTSIGGSAFSGCYRLTSITVEAGNPNYDSRGNCNALIETNTNTLLAGCVNTVIPDDVTAIGPSAFSDVDMNSVTIPNGVTSIGNSAFWRCRNLTSIEIPNSVTSIGSEAFSVCLNLTSVKIGNGITTIGGSAFSNCDNLADVYCYAENVPQAKSSSFGSKLENVTLHVPATSLEAYKATDPWSKFGKIVAIDGDENTNSQTFIFGEKNYNYWYHWNPDGSLDNTQVQGGWSAIPFYVEAPRYGITLKDNSWISPVSQGLIQNRVAIEGKSKYYFAPKGDIRITAQNGITYTITPQGAGNQTDYNKLISQDGEKFTWDEANLENILKSHTVVYGGEGAGVFNNDILYAYANGKYTPIIRLMQEQDDSNRNTYNEAGRLELIKYLPVGSREYDFLAGSAEENTVLYDVLNAIGYPNLSADGNDYSQCDLDHSNKNINRQLRAWIGYVKDNGKNVAQYVEQGKYDDDNKTTFLASWNRPINLYFNEPEPILTEEEDIYLIDYLRLYDWRGDKPKYGYMYDDHYWFWGFYNVKEIDVDLRPDMVLTNLHQKEPNSWVPLSTVSSPIELSALYRSENLGKYTFDLTQNYLNDGANLALLEYMGISPVDLTNKARFGGISYKKNGEADANFTIQVPVTVKYEFGGVSAMMTIKFGSGSQEDPETITFTTSKGLTFEGNTKTQKATLTAVNAELAGEVVVPEIAIKNGTPFTVTKIGEDAFDNCGSIEKVELPKTIEEFTAGALSDCVSLKEINVIEGGYSICSVDGVLYSISRDVLMAYPALKGEEYDIPASVTTIFDDAFAYAHITNLYVNAKNPNAILVTDAFTGFNFGDCVLNVPVGTAADYRRHQVWGQFKTITGEEKVDLGGGVTVTVGDDGNVTFKSVDKDQAVGDFEIPATVVIDGKEYPVTTIAPGAFKDCKDLVSVTIPEDITEIGDGAFSGCTGLEAIYNRSKTPVKLGSQLVRTRTGKIITQFEGIDFDTCILYVPVGSKEAYQNAEGWNQFKHIVELEALGIDDVTQSSSDVDVYFSLHGQRVINPTSGLYIKNGKNVFVK